MLHFILNKYAYIHIGEIQTGFLRVQDRGRRKENRLSCGCAILQDISSQTLEICLVDKTAHRPPHSVV